MTIEPLPIDGCFLLVFDQHVDQRGAFERCSDRQLLQSVGLPGDWDHSALSRNTHQGTVRGMHWQAAPHGEHKLVRCLRGAMFDAIVDIRPDSPTFLHTWSGLLSDENRRTLAIAPGIAHGFLTLTDDVDVLYHIATSYEPASARGARWNDPAFHIDWPQTPKLVCKRDSQYPDFNPSRDGYTVGDSRIQCFQGGPLRG